MKKNSFYYIFICLTVLFSCADKQKETEISEKAITILIQPFEDIQSQSLEYIAGEIKKIYPNVKILDPIGFPENTYYQPRNRYRADSVISFLSKKTEEGFVTIGLTSKDISVTKGKIEDFGVMGLGYRPGNACIASSFRLNKKNQNEQFFKIAIHELGHTQGLKHCPVKTCFMRDAEGKNPTNDEIDFCKKCKELLITKNWKFNSL